MKLRGQRLDEKANIPVVFERPTKKIVFWLSAVLNTSDFDKICPAPTPPMKIARGGIKVLNDNDPKYLQARLDRNRLYNSWLVLQTMSGTPELEWEQVKMDDPNTWSLWEKELRESGLSDGELIYLMNKVVEINGLDQKKLDEARDTFLLEQEKETL